MKYEWDKREDAKIIITDNTCGEIINNTQDNGFEDWFNSSGKMALSVKDLCKKAYTAGYETGKLVTTTFKNNSSKVVEKCKVCHGTGIEIQGDCRFCK